jgi:Skp family chaperone for outer membrane proteins
MNRKFSLFAALVAGLLPMAAFAQVSPTVPASPSQTPAPPAQKPIPPPTAYPAKIALIAFEQAVIATNEGQRAVADINTKYAPRKTEIGRMEEEVDSLKKQLQAAPATLPDEERQSRLKTIDAKEKKLNLEAEEATNSYNEDLQKAYSGVAQKVNVVLRSYVQQAGYTILLDVSNQQSAVMWASADPNSDITEAVINAYNAASGVAAPTAPAPSATARPRPTTTTPRPATTTPKTTAPKQ